jgi:hypothetical protein
VFGYAEAAVHWQRAIELCHAQPGAARTDELGLYLRATYALAWSGDSGRAGAVAEEAYSRLAGHPDTATAAAVRHRAAYFQAIETPDAGLPLIEEAVRLYEQAPPSAEHAEAWLDYAHIFLHSAEGRREGISPALRRALEIAEAASATALIPRILASLAAEAFRRGQMDDGFAFLDRGRALAREANDAWALLAMAASESDALLKLARFQDAADVALRGLGTARQAGLIASSGLDIVAGNACEALLAVGRTAEAAALIDPLTTGPPDRHTAAAGDRRPLHPHRPCRVRSRVGAARRGAGIVGRAPQRRPQQGPKSTPAV